MVRTYKDIPKRAKNSITCQLDKLMKKYGEKTVRLITLRCFEKSSKQRQLENEIYNADEKLKELKKKKN